MNKKPNIFKVTSTPKNSSNILSLKPEIAKQYFCAVVNVSDSICATFDYQKESIPSFWFPINEVAQWGHSPFFGTLRVVNEYYEEGGKPVLIHCHAGANRSPSVAYAILLAKGYSPEEAEESLDYNNLSSVFQRNIERNHIPKDIIDVLKEANNNPTDSLHYVLQNTNGLYQTWSKKKLNEQNDCVFRNPNNGDLIRLIYKKDKKRFMLG